MRSFIPGPIRGFLGLTAFAVNTLFWGVPVYIISFFKLTIPWKRARATFDIILNRLSYTWMYCNNFFIAILKNAEYEVEGLKDLDMNEWYLVMANHQSLTDIIVLQKIFHNRIPFLKYFLKRELILVPILGLAWWALDYPFMKRYSRDFLEKNPHLKGRDIEMTRRSCEKFKDKPASIMNFVEGTRFTMEKREKQKSPYRHLLKPRSGGIAFVLSAMGGRMRKIIDVTIVYPGGAEGIWKFLCRRRTRIRVHIDVFPITPWLTGNYFEDEDFQEKFQNWLNGLWSKKDRRMEEILARESGR